ncbi:M20/M25/M40 family metallo-hydrolase [Bosea sp. SSUT16]|jgi:acetylornithine deacetylase/succinyl-diaminopimelate desuccinylase-like protein|uniref:M20/M25/M40 family metallo-hydrolase n=1 Tax=Bosea spartocytisi TaxID=2773451 RepID=A0A927E4Z0_9HYPH|nr:M20/M25/M40 family metallo-hydrolase [Bosea spartocytisi]MBD3844478.1 M20/M25/M40 family metallo-hydrolase [Bosea spartocytisi]MCT4470416.1 M20/M25/M40 family metallo-hydrolase [Bosea spartocytisi]
MTQKPDAALTAVFDHIDANRESFLSRVMDYVRYPSISAHDIGIGEVAALLVDMIGQIGLDVELIPTTGHPMVVGRWNKAPGAPTVLLYGHYDVQPPEPLEAWISPPFEPTIRDGRIYARGIGDNKGQHFAQLMALESHMKVHGRLPCNVIVLLEGEEEIGSPRIADFIATYRDRLKADFVVTSDGGMHPSGLPTMTYGVRGIATFELRVRHARRDVHSGNFGGVVPNPIWTLVHLLGTMKNAKGEITIEGLHDAVIPPGALEKAAAARLPLDLPGVMSELGLSRLDAPADRPFYDRLMFHPTLTINGLHGGYGGPGSKTVLPCEAFAKCDIRLIDNQTPADVLAKVEAHVKRHAPEVEFVYGHGMLPSRVPMDTPWAQILRDAITTAQGVAPLEYPSMGGSLPDYVFTKTLGIPAFVVPYANADEANHAPNENMKIDCFYNGIRTGAALLDRLGRPSM